MVYGKIDKKYVYIMKEEPLFLLKYGEKKYMHSLITKGEVFLNTRKHYRDIEDMEIGDSWEAMDEIRQAKISKSDKVNIDWKIFATDIPVGISDERYHSINSC